MNKHTYISIVIGIVAIVSSFLFWTNQIHTIVLPRVSQSIVDSVNDTLNAWFGVGDTEDEIVLKEHIVEDLGEHFVTRIQRTHLTASVTSETVRERIAPQEEPQPEPEPEEVLPEPEPSPEPVHASAPIDEELTQWELTPVWTIAIPSLGIRAPVLLPSMQNWSSRAWGILEEQMQIGLNHGTVAYPHSSAPGTNGNLIVAGHSSPPTRSAEQSAFGSVFARLPEIGIGEEIQVSSARYVVQEKFVVSPQETSILEQQHDESILKLITCYPVGTTKERMIVLAKKIEE